VFMVVMLVIWCDGLLYDICVQLDHVRCV